MRCKIASLIVDVPEAGGLAPRCGEYLWEGNENPDIVISEEKYRRERYPETISYDALAYMESGRQFASQLLYYDGFYLHASAVVVDGKAYLFSGTSGVGKSTHMRLWKTIFGENIIVINDDKPVLRYIDGRWLVYGTPWCGKDGINRNMSAVLAGICFLKQAPENRIYRLSPSQAVSKIVSQTIYRFSNKARAELLFNHIEKLVLNVPIFELENKPEIEAAELSYQTMSKSFEESC